ncbi:MAG: hypothetical protein ABL883_11760 [Terricaulis sp.]
MAILREARSQERGLSLIEALIVVTLTTMMALLLLPMVSGVGARNFARVKHAIATADLVNAETEFRTLLASAIQDRRVRFSGTQSLLVFAASPAALAACVAPGAPATVRLSVVDLQPGGALICEGTERRELLRWPSGSGRFSYNVGSGWMGNYRELPLNDAAPPGYTPPLVRFEIGDGEAAWIAAAGWSEPTRIDEGGRR